MRMYLGSPVIRHDLINRPIVGIVGDVLWVIKSREVVDDDREEIVSDFSFLYNISDDGQRM